MEKKACELGETKHVKLERAGGAGWMALGWILPSTPARGERVLGPSVAGTVCFSNASIRGGCRCALYFFAFLPQSLTVN